MKRNVMLHIYQHKMVTSSNNNNNKTSTSQSATLFALAEDTEPKNSEIFYPPETSIIEAFAARGITNSQSKSSTSSIRTFIYGPSKSGKTSVAMDFAHSLACQHINNENNNNSKSVSLSEQHNGDYSDCNVIILRHRRNNSEKSPALFPMRCYCGSHTKRNANSKLPPNEWNEQALDKVTILYLESYSDLVQMLASIQMHFPSIHCLIIDDLDQFLPQSTTSNNSNEFTPTSNTSTSLMIVQTIALSTDAVNFLEQYQQRQQSSSSVPEATSTVHSGVHLVITINEAFFPLVLRPIVFNWMTSILHFTVDNSNSSNMSAALSSTTTANPSSDRVSSCNCYNAFWEYIETNTPSLKTNHRQRLPQRARLAIRPDLKFSILENQNIHIHFIEWNII